MIQRRKSITISLKRKVWEKTGGRCHVCGRVLVFDARMGKKGRWQIDHIVPVKKGGKDKVKNFLPICRICNRLKWHFKGRKIRKLFQFGVIAWRESERQTGLGWEIKKLYQRRLKQNLARRKGKLPAGYYR